MKVWIQLSDDGEHWRDYKVGEGEKEFKYVRVLKEYWDGKIIMSEPKRVTW